MPPPPGVAILGMFIPACPTRVKKSFPISMVFNEKFSTLNRVSFLADGPLSCCWLSEKRFMEPNSSLSPSARPSSLETRAATEPDFPARVSFQCGLLS
ncbi:hypothetical protein D9M69_608880 [compost metagenome]